MAEKRTSMAVNEQTLRLARRLQQELHASSLDIALRIAISHTLGNRERMRNGKFLYQPTGGKIEVPLFVDIDPAIVNRDDERMEEY